MTTEMRHLWFDGTGSVGAGYHYALPIAVGTKKVQILVVGSGEVVKIARADWDRAPSEEITRWRARRAVKKIIKRRRLIGSPITAPIKMLYESLEGGASDHE